MRGDCQWESIDYKETFAPIIKSTSLCVFFALAAIIGLRIHHLDVTAAFLNGTLKEVVYMCQPKGFEETGKETWVWKLNRALYGLKQGGHEWYACINNFFMQELGFMCTFADHSVYVYELDSSLIIVPLYVNDLLISYKDEEHMLQIRTMVLGMRVHVDMHLGTISIDQSQYVCKMLQRFGMSDCKLVTMPLPEKTVLRAATDNEVEATWDTHTCR